MGNIQDGELELSSLKFLPRSHDEFPALLLRPGDVLFNRTNSAELVGKSAVYRGKPAVCSFASYLIRVRLRDQCLPDYLVAVLNSSYGRAWVATVVSQQVGQANVSGGKLKRLAIPVPPIAEQRAMVATLVRAESILERQHGQIDASLAMANSLRQAVLHQGFSGTLVSSRSNSRARELASR